MKKMRPSKQEDDDQGEEPGSREALPQSATQMQGTANRVEPNLEGNARVGETPPAQSHEPAQALPEPDSNESWQEVKRVMNRLNSRRSRERQNCALRQLQSDQIRLRRENESLRRENQQIREIIAKISHLNAQLRSDPLVGSTDEHKQPLVAGQMQTGPFVNMMHDYPSSNNQNRTEGWHQGQSQSFDVTNQVMHQQQQQMMQQQLIQLATHLATSHEASPRSQSGAALSAHNNFGVVSTSSNNSSNHFGVTVSTASNNSSTESTVSAPASSNSNNEFNGTSTTIQATMPSGDVQQNLNLLSLIAGLTGLQPDLFLRNDFANALAQYLANFQTNQLGASTGQNANMQQTNEALLTLLAASIQSQIFSQGSLLSRENNNSSQQAGSSLGSPNIALNVNQRAPTAGQDGAWAELDTTDTTTDFLFTSPQYDEDNDKPD